MIAALLLDMIRYKLAWWLFIYQRVLCVKFVASVSYLSKWEDAVYISRLIVTCTTKKAEKKLYLSIIWYVVARFRRYNFEGLSCIYRRRVIRGIRWARGKFKGTRRLSVDFGKKPESPCYWGGSSILLYKFSNSHWKHMYLTQNFATNPSVVVRFAQCQ